jgi:hypothetical protein
MSSKGKKFNGEYDSKKYPISYRLAKTGNPDRSVAFKAVEELKTKKEIMDFFNEYTAWLREYGDTKQVRDKAEDVASNNLGYIAGYYDEETRAKIYDTLGDCHPIFGRC